MRRLILFFLLSVSLSALMPGCNKPDTNKPSPASSYDRKGMLTNLANNLIIPSYTSYQKAVASLDSAVAAFNNAPDAAKLSAVQASLKTAYLAWETESVFEVGPAEMATLRVNTNTYPADISQINANITQGVYNPLLLANLAAKGLPAIDYLVAGTAADNTGILAQYTTDSKATNRKNYLASLTAEMKTNASTVLNAWNGSYKTTFINAAGTDQGSATGQLVNQLVYDFEILKNDEVGIPLGKQSMGTIYPEKVQGYYSKISVQLALAHIQAMQNIYLGKGLQGDGMGLDDYLIYAKAKYSDGRMLDDVIKAQFNTAIAKLQALTDPLSDQIKNNPSPVSDAYTELQKLTVLLKTDMTSSLGILITFGDNDGD